MMNLAIIFQGNWSSKYFSAIHTTRIFDQFTTSVWLYARCFHPNLSPKDARTQLVVFSEFLEEMDKWWTLIILFVIFSINILYTNLVKMFEFFEDCSCLKYSRHFFPDTRTVQITLFLIFSLTGNSRYISTRQDGPLNRLFFEVILLICITYDIIYMIKKDLII